MVHVKYGLYENDFQLSVCGHAGYDKKGSDIVCAGVSALVRALQVCLERDLFLSDAAFIEKAVDDGFAGFRVADTEDCELARRIYHFFFMCVSGLREIAEQYPDYVEITDIAALEASYIDTPEQTAENE